MMTGGYHSFGPGGFRESPLADVLPIDIGPAQRQNFDEPLRTTCRSPRPAADAPGRAARHEAPDHAIERSVDAQAPSGTSLPPLDGANLIERRELKPNAAVLAEADDARRHPLLVAGQSGDGRVLAFAGDSTWRWQMQGFGDAHRRFWRQVVLWLAKKDEQTEGQVWIRLAGRRVMRGTRVDFTLGAENSRGEPIDRGPVRPSRSKRPTAARSTSAPRRAATTGPPCSAKPTSRATTASRSRHNDGAQLNSAPPRPASWSRIRTSNSTAPPPSRA